MNFKDLVRKARSCRRFRESEPVSREQALALVDLARVAPCASNEQALKYFVSADRETNAKIFPATRWAGALKDWDGPEEGERPAAYILILVDKQVRETPGCDHGIAAQTMLLAAAEAGIAGCMLGALDRPTLRRMLNIPERFDIALVLALGRPAETIVLEPLGPDGRTAYWRDAASVHHVPKRSLDEVVVSF